MALNLGILIFDEVEVMDFCGPFEVFSVTSSLFPQHMNRVILIADTPTIKTRGGMVVQAEHIIGGDSPLSLELDILLVPGGIGADEVVKNEKVLGWIKEIRPSLKYVISVCTGASILGKCGFLDGLVITTHHSAFKEVAENCPNSTMCTCRRFIDSETIYTSAGISAGIDASLYLLKKLFGNQVPEGTVKVMEYIWTDPDVRPCKCVCGAEEKAASER